MTLIVFLVWFWFANTFAGGKWKPILRQHGGPLPGRGIYYSGLATIVVGYLLYGPLGALVGVSFVVWRLPGWYAALDMGTVGHTFGRDFAVMWARALLLFPAFLYVAWLAQAWEPIGLLVVGGVLQPISYAIGNRFKGVLTGWVNESLSGLSLGLVFYLLLQWAGYI